jgi:hypothetical protein
MVPLLCCCPFHQCVQLSANLIDPFPQLPMLRHGHRRAPFLSEVLAIVLCNLYKLKLKAISNG